MGIGANLAGPAIAVSFFICGMACCFTSLAYAEFAARVPLSGSAYTFTYVSFGELCGWLVGWNLTLGYCVSAAVVARSWAEYLVGFVQGIVVAVVSSDDALVLQYYLTKLPILPSILGDDYTCCPLSVAIIGLCTLILVKGVKESTRFNTAMTLLNLALLLFVLLSGLGSGSVHVAENWNPFFPHGITGMARGAGLVFFSYLGFDMVSCLSEECQHPERTMPIGIIGSLMVSMSVYVSVSLVVVGMAPIKLLGPDTPIVNALLANACCTTEQQSDANVQQSCLSYTLCDPILHPLLYVGSRFISFGAIFGLTTATFACLMGQPRINFAAAQDGLLFPIFAKVNPHTGVPTAGTILTGIFTAVVACFVDLESLANAISLGTLQVFSFVNAGVIILRMRGPTCFADTNDNDANGNDVIPNETSLLLNMDRLVTMAPMESSQAVVIPDPTAAVTARTLGLIPKSSREIRQLVQQQDSERHIMDSNSSRSSRSGGGIDDAQKPICYVLLFTVASIIASHTAANNNSDNDNDGDKNSHLYFLFTLTVCGVIMVVTAILLWQYPKSPPPDTFTCPFVPVVPLLGILCNAYMMGSMPHKTWFLVMGWLLVGLVFYLSYGIHHSKLKTSSRSSRSGAFVGGQISL